MFLEPRTKNEKVVDMLIVGRFNRILWKGFLAVRRTKHFVRKCLLKNVTEKESSDV